MNNHLPTWKRSLKRFSLCLSLARFHDVTCPKACFKLKSQLKVFALTVLTGIRHTCQASKVHENGMMYRQVASP